MLAFYLYGNGHCGIALGIGANSVIFSAVDAVLLRDAPVADPDSLVDVYTSSGNNLYSPSSYRDYFDLRDSGTFASLAAYTPVSITMDANDQPEPLAGPLVSGDISRFLASRCHSGAGSVFQAFREVEVAVRTAGAFPPDMVGVQLMRAAFRPVNEKTAQGPLTDTELPAAEQEAMAGLFAGAIGLYKNPQSHRHVPTSPVDAAEVIGLASQLLRLVESRSGKG